MNTRPRRILAAQASAIALAAAMLPLNAHADPVTEPTLIDLGPAAVGTAVNGAELIGDDLFLVSRQSVPPTLTRLNLTSGEVTQVTTIPSGIEGWAATAVNDGTDLYFGMHTPADVYHYDVTTDTLTTPPATTLPRELLVMDQIAAPDDVIYIAGMARGASGGVYAYDPATGETEDLGMPVPGQRYVRSIEADDTRVYAGMGPAASLMYRDRDGGEWTEIPIPEIEGESFVYDMAVAGDHLTFGTEPSGLFGVVDLSTMQAEVISVPDGRTVDSIVTDETHAYFTVRPEGTLYSYELATGELESLGVPSVGAEHRKLFRSGDDIIGVTGAGDVWIRSLTTGEVQLLTSIDTGMPRSPERAAQSLTVFEGNAYVGGHWGIQQHQGTTGVSERFPIAGEPKTMVGDDGVLYASVYPAGQVWTVDPATGDSELLVQIRDNQMRPRASLYDDVTDTLIVSTREVYGNVGGAISVIDPATGAIETYRDVAVDQAPISLTSINGVVYAGHEIAGEVHDPTTPEALLAAMDIETGETLWSMVPVPGAPAINGVVATNTPDGPVVYGVTSNGWLFAVDPADGSLIESTRIGNNAQQIVETGAGIFALIQGRIYQVTGHAPNLELELIDNGPFTHLVPDDTDDYRLYAVGLRTVDGVSMARLFALEMPVTHSVIRWEVRQDGELTGGSTVEVVLPSGEKLMVTDNGPLDADPDDGQFLLRTGEFGHHRLQQQPGAEKVLLDRGTQHARTSLDEPSVSLEFANRTHPGKGR